MPDQDVRLRLLIEAVDRASRQLQDVGKQLSSVKTQVDQVNSKSKQMGAEGAAGVAKFADSLTKLAQKFKAVEQAGDRMVNVGKALAATGATLGGAAFFPIKSAASFERAMSRVEAVTKGSEEDFKALREEAKRMGRETQFTASQAADGVRFLGMAGLDARQAFDALGPTLDLAAAGELSMAEAADFATNITSAFGLEVDDLSHVMDVLAYTAANSNTDVRQLADAMRYAGPIAKSAGISIDQAASVVGVLSSNGIQASMAGTTLRGVIASLLSPTDQAQEALDRLGVQVQKNADGTLDLQGTFEELEKAGLSAGDAIEIFRRTAASGATVLASSTQKTKEFTEEIENSDGAASQMRETIEDNLVGAWARLTSAIDGFLTAVGEPFLDQLGAFTDGIATVINSMTEWAKENPNVTSALLKVVGTLAVLVTALGGVLIPLGLVVKGFGALSAFGLTGAAALLKMIPGLTGVATGLKAVAVAGGAATAALKVGLILAAAAALWELYKAAMGAYQAFVDLELQQDKLSRRLTDLQNKYKDYANVVNEAFRTTAESIRGSTSEELAKQQDEIAKSTAYWRVLRLELEGTAAETTWLGRSTEEAKAAQEELKKVDERLKVLRSTRQAILEEQQARGEDITGAKIAEKETKAKEEQTEATRKLTKEELEAIEKRKAALEEWETYRITQMEDGLEKFEALRKQEIDAYKASEDAKALTADEVGQRIALIDQKYSDQKKEFLEAQAQEEADLKIQLAEKEQELLAAVQEGQLAELDRQHEGQLISTQEYYDQRKALITEAAEAEIETLRLAMESASETDRPSIEIDIAIAQEALETQLAAIDAQLDAHNAAKIQKEQEFQQQLADLREQHSGVDARTLQHQQELEAFDAHTDQLIAMAEESGAGIDAINEIYSMRQRDRAQAQADFELQTRQMVLDGTRDGLSTMGDLFGDLYEATGKKHKEFFLLQKGFAIAEAIIGTYQSAQQAYLRGVEVPIIGAYLGPVLAAAAIAAGMARVAMIKQQSAASGGEIEGHSPSDRADNIPIWATAGEFMMPVKSVRKYGKRVMEGMRRGIYPVEMFSGYSVKGLPAAPRHGFYQTGGAITQPSTGGQSSAGSDDTAGAGVTINNIVDPSMMDQHIQSTPGQKSVMNVLSQNQFALKQLVSQG